jgi:4'-phosphopantetheinyl transferase
MTVQSAEVTPWVQGCRRWHRAPASPSLGREDVHVWRVSLDAPQDVVADLVPLLSGEEKARARQMDCDTACRHFVASHGALRRILSRYREERPEQIRFVADVQGKPHLASRAGAPTLCFSLSHSGEFALIAVASARDVGVDIERIRPLSAWREIVERYFSRSEREALSALSSDQAPEAFFHGWTRKEAYSKALGQGVSQRWRQFTVSLTPGVATQLPGAGPASGTDGRLTNCPLAPGSGYVAAVAARGVGWHLSCWQWSWATQ